MEIVGQQVSHKTLGSGVIISYYGMEENGKNYILVRFESKEARFPFPKVFEKTLSSVDAEFDVFVKEELSKISKRSEFVLHDTTNIDNAKSDTGGGRKKNVNQVHRPISYCSKNTFTFLLEKRFNKERNRSGFSTLDNEGRIVGVASMHTDKRGPAYGQAELCFFDEYVSEFGQWRLVSINKERLSFSKLIKLLEENGSCKLTIDPRKGS